MKESVIAAIMAAVGAYIQQEDVTKAFAAIATPHPEVSPWRLFGQQELFRARTNWRTRRATR
ncbi:MAG TPA: hypothetical protein G4O12_05160 [Dehalococcoidia bacterium]|nr:hypothetical protein [Dehalococcoidia bacterium]